MKRWIVAFATACACAAAAAPAGAKSYGVERVESDVTARRDGALHVSERISFSFHGRFRYGYRDLVLKPGERVSDVSVAEAGAEYRRAPGDEPGTFSITESGNHARVTWHFRARNERRTFVLGYTLNDVIQRDSDWAEIYFQFVGDQWDRPIGSVVARLRLPQPADREHVRAWAHGPLYGRVEFLDDGRLGFDVAPLPAHTFWEGRVLAPSAWFSGTPVSPGSGRLQRVLAQEKAWAEEANARREALRRDAEAAARAEVEKRARIPGFLAIASVLALIGMGAWSWLYSRHGRPHRVDVHAAPGEPPSEHSPALLQYLMQEMVGGRAVVGTLLDLAHRGYFEIHERVDERPRRWWSGKRGPDFRFERTSKDAADLAPYERDLVEFLMTEVGEGGGFTMSALKKTASKSRSKFFKWFRAWTRQVKAAGREAGFFEPYPAGAMVLNALIGVVILVSGVLLCVFSDSAAGLPAVVVGLIQAILTAALHRRSPEGRRLFVEWRDFKRHLGSIARALGPVSLDSAMWGRYLAAAIVFGMVEKLLPKLRLADGAAGGGYYPVWYHAAVASDAGGLSTMAGNFSAMVSAVSSTMSSASGTGGGASAGGGGGSGGGGGGAG